MLVATGVLGVAGSLVVSLLLWGGPATSFRGMVVARQLRALLQPGHRGYATVLVLLLSIGLSAAPGVEPGEYYALVLFATVGMMLMAAGRPISSSSSSRSS